MLGWGKIRPPQFSFRSDGCVEAPVLNRIAVTALITSALVRF